MVSCRWIVPAWLLASTVLPAYAQIDVSAAQKKLLSRRAAEADAYRKLAETIKGLQINSHTYVKDFVAESDEIRTRADGFVGAVRLGAPRWFEDLSCEVPAEVALDSVVKLLEEAYTCCYKGRDVQAADLQAMPQHLERKVLRVVGRGAPRFDLPSELPAGAAVEGIEDLPPPPPEPLIPDLWKPPHMPANARIGAEQAAERDAQRRLLERILGLRVNSETLVRDFVTQSDQIRTSAAGTIRGFTRTRTYYHHDEPIVEVTLEIPAETVVATIRELYSRCERCGQVRSSDITEVVRSIRAQKFEATGMGVPRPEFLQMYNRAAAAPDRLPAWAMTDIRVAGSALPPPEKAGTPQGQLLAARGAEVDAKRRLGERVYGLSLSSGTTIESYATRHDEVHAYLDAIIANAVVTNTRFRGDGSAEVTVVLPGMQVWDAVRQVEGAAPGGSSPGTVQAPGDGAAAPAAPARSTGQP